MAFREKSGSVAGATAKLKKGPMQFDMASMDVLMVGALYMQDTSSVFQPINVLRVVPEQFSRRM